MSTNCGERFYSEISRPKMDYILEQLKQSGSTITGNNPWDVDTHNMGIKLRGNWNEKESTLVIIVTEKNIVVPCMTIWKKIDELINKIPNLKMDVV